MSKKLIQAAAGAGGESVYVEDVFSTFLYEGNGSTQTITNGIDLDGEGGLVWGKKRNGSENHVLFDTEAQKRLETNTTASGGSGYIPTYFNFLADGYFMDWSAGGMPNDNGDDYVSWTFRKAEKFFDVVTYTGDETTNRMINHNLGSTPGFIIVKAINYDGGNPWSVYHRSLGATKGLRLNTTSAAGTDIGYWYNQSPTDTQFGVGADSQTNGIGKTYVAYLFAHDAGGFGDDGDESIIKCGSFAGVNSPSNVTVNLGWEPQWVLVKVASGDTNSWLIFDNMRGVPTGITDAFLKPDSSNAESTSSTLNYIDFNATGFTVTGDFQGMASGRTFIYIAIRRPMKTPESGTEVFATDINSSTNTTPIFTASFTPDFVFAGKDSGTDKWYVSNRLTGDGKLNFNSTSAEVNNVAYSLYFNGAYSNAFNGYSGWMFKRATGFFDVVAYTGTGSAMTISHNLNVIPELMIVRRRDNTTTTQGQWKVYTAPTGNQKYLLLENNNALSSVQSTWQSTTPTSDEFYLGTGSNVVNSGGLFIAYLFATLAGVSKVGSYTGTAANLDVDCGFSAGARFILIKRTDAGGDWYVWDSERGIVAGNDPYLLLNSTAAEVTSTDYIDPLSSGFTVTSSAPAALNASGGTYIFLAIA